MPGLGPGTPPRRVPSTLKGRVLTQCIGGRRPLAQVGPDVPATAGRRNGQGSPRAMSKPAEHRRRELMCEHLLPWSLRRGLHSRRYLRVRRRVRIFDPRVSPADATPRPIEGSPRTIEGPPNGGPSTLGSGGGYFFFFFLPPFFAVFFAAAFFFFAGTLHPLRSGERAPRTGTRIVATITSGSIRFKGTSVFFRRQSERYASRRTGRPIVSNG